MAAITQKDKGIVGRKSMSQRIAYALAAFLYCVATTASAVDSETWYYGLDNVGNITSRGTDSQNPTHSYGYDGIYRLTDETNPSNTDQYSYDANGNRTDFTRDGASTSYQIDSNSNRLDQVGSDPRTYDNIGNTKTDRDGTRTFTYNQAGRLTQVHEDGLLLATYTYNAQGQRSIKTTPNGTTYYLYDTNGQLIGEYDESGQPVKEYVHLSGEPIAQVETSNITYLHTDHLATPRKATNEAGDVVWKWDSEAFGNKSPESSGGTTVNLRFPGQYYDSETGLNYNYFRYYDSETGRYITSDPIGLEGGLNTYAYVGGNPLYWIDPFGLYCLTDREINAIAGGIGGAFSGVVAGKIFGPWGAAALGGIGGLFGAGLGYFGTDSEGGQIAAGAANAVATSTSSPLSSAFGGAFGGAVSNYLQSNGVRDTKAGIVGGGAGGFVGAGSAAFLSRNAPNSVSRALSFAFKGSLRGGLAGMSGAALSAAIAEALRAGNNCSVDGCE